MKKNLMSIIILGMVVANLVVSVLILLTINQTSTKVGNLIGDIASVMTLELNDKSVAVEPQGLTPDNIDVYNIEDEMTIAFKLSPDSTKQRYCLLKVALQMDKTNEDYAAFSAGLKEKETLIKGIINDVVGSHTLEEMQVDQQGIKDEILQEIQKLYDSNFIYQVNFVSYIPQ